MVMKIIVKLIQLAHLYVRYSHEGRKENEQAGDAQKINSWLTNLKLDARVIKMNKAQLYKVSSVIKNT